MSIDLAQKAAANAEIGRIGMYLRRRRLLPAGQSSILAVRE